MPAPKSRPSAEPNGPAMGRKVVPGITNEPQPTAQPKASAHIENVEKPPTVFLLSELFPPLIIIVSPKGNMARAAPSSVLIYSK